jgi:branched-chain amino acid transport system substrate-binding protein
MKGFSDRGLPAAGIKLVSTGDLTDEDVLDAMGDDALGLITAGHYAEAHKSPENAAYVAAYAKAYPKDRPNFMSVAGYDGMRLIAETLNKTKGVTDADVFIEAVKGAKWVSPRGAISIDPATRDIVQTVYVRKVEKVGGRLQNIVFDQVPDFKDPGKP